MRWSIFTTWLALPESETFGENRLVKLNFEVTSRSSRSSKLVEKSLKKVASDWIFPKASIFSEGES